MSNRRLVRAAAVFSGLALILAACGDDGDDEASTEGTSASGAEETTTTAEGGGGAATGGGDGVLTIGTLLPETGSLAFLGPPEVAGVQLAIDEINAAGGVLGQDIVLVTGDSGDTSTDIANQTTDRLLEEGVDGIIGAASSGVTLTVIEKITSAGVIQISPANTSTELTTTDDNGGFYFRTAPPDVFQGGILGDLFVESGCARVGVFALDDPYGTGLADEVSGAVTAAGGEVPADGVIIYDPAATTFDAEVQQMVGVNPDCIGVFGFDESARLVATMAEQGIGPADVQVFGSDGNMGFAFGDQLEDASVLAGMRGTTPFGERAFGEFQDRLLAVDPDLRDLNYAGESYDAVVLLALAAIQAESDDPADMQPLINDLTRGGEKCEDFASCLAIIEAGGDVDYDGISGPLEFSDVGEPTFASFGILEFDAEGQIIIPVEEFRTANT